MACGVPVVATDVGGDTEVVCRPELGTIVALNDRAALHAALDDALSRDRGQTALIGYARASGWWLRIADLQAIYRQVLDEVGGEAPV